MIDRLSARYVVSENIYVKADTRVWFRITSSTVAKPPSRCKVSRDFCWIETQLH